MYLIRKECAPEVWEKVIADGETFIERETCE